MSRLMCLSCALFLVFLTGTLVANDTSQLNGERGHLVLIGGGSKPQEVLRTFVRLAGGKDAPIVVIPTASSLPDTGSYYEELFQTQADCTNVTALEIRTREDAQNPDFVGAIDKASGVFFSGGDQNKITGTIGGTAVEDAIARLYFRGKVIGGTSAGTACQSSPMITGNGDMSYIAAGNIELKEGLGFFPGIIIDQHFIARQRQNRLISVVLEHPERLGIGVDEATAVWLKPDLTFEVLGRGSVFVYDARWATIRKAKTPDTKKEKPNLGVRNLKTHILLPGDSFSLKHRRPLP